MNLREWCVITFVLGFVAFAATVAKFSGFQAKKVLQDSPPPKTVSIHLSGAIRNPGHYACTPGTSLKELLKKAGIQPTANRRKIPFMKILLSDQEIQIPEKKRGAHGI
ncbi:MAG: hypothetical protein KR126chlam3_00042 [Chlamydiae bacterium]|nr:hypothetical protein [Chlamydiota bacterium]